LLLILPFLLLLPPLLLNIMLLMALALALLVRFFLFCHSPTNIDGLSYWTMRWRRLTRIIHELRADVKRTIGSPSVTDIGGCHRH